MAGFRDARVTRLGDAGVLPRLSAAARGLLRPRLPAGRPGAACLVVGHRGAAAQAPENTIASFRRALELGADAIETDVSVTADGRFALWHDADPDERVALARQLGAERLAYRPEMPALGSPWRKRVRELRAEDLSSHYGYVPSASAKAPARGPRRAAIEYLDDLLAWAPTAPALRHIFLDIKLAEDQGAAARSLVAFLRKAAPRLGACAVHLLSPQVEIVEALAAAVAAGGSSRDAALRVSADFELPGAGSIGPRTGADDVSLGSGGRLWTGFRYDVGEALRARDRGLVQSVVAWTINERDRLETLVSAGVDGILTDEPALLRSLVPAAAEPAAPFAGVSLGR